MSGQVRFTFAGSPAFTKRLAELEGEGERAVAAGLRVLGEKIRGDSILQTPVDTGNLRASHYVESADGVRGPIVEIGVGGPSQPYAVRQHEDMSLRHPVGNAKFLENAFNANTGDEGLSIVADVARRQMGM